MPIKAAFYKEILDNLYDGVYFVDRLRRITFWNKGAERITGFSSQRVLGYSCSDHLLMHVDDEGQLLCLNGCPLEATLHDGDVHEAEVYLHHADGHRVPVLVRVAPLRNEGGEIIGGVETFSDNTSMIAERRRVHELHEVAMQDPLTGVWNRRYIELKSQNNLIESSQGGLAMGFLFIDIDHFKKVNDTWGHEVGDRVLKMVASTLQHNIRATDFIGRWGGEEFVIVIPNLDQERLVSIVGKLRSLVESSRLSAGKEDIQVTISIGATLSRQEDTLETLIKRADALLYKSKAAGRNCATFSGD